MGASLPREDVPLKYPTRATPFDGGKGEEVLSLQNQLDPVSVMTHFQLYHTRKPNPPSRKVEIQHLCFYPHNG